MTDKLFLILLILCAVFVAGCGSPTDTAANNTATVAEDPAAIDITEAEVKEALESLRSTVEKNDTEGLLETYSDDYLLVNTDGKTATKAERMESLKTGSTKYESVEFKDSKIRTYGNVAVVVTNASGKGTIEGVATELDMTATLVFVKTADGVSEVSAHLTNKAKE